MEPVTAREADIEQYLHHLEHERGLLPRTIAGYRDELRQLLRRDVVLSAEALTRFVGTSTEGTALLPSTRNHRLNIVRGFVRWLVEHGRLPADPTAGIRHARVPRVQRSALSIGELRRVVAAIRAERSSWRRTRDETVVLLLFYSGLRIHELLGLDLGQVDAGGRSLRQVRRKGGHVVDVPLAEVTVELLARWFVVRPPSYSSALFCSGDGRRLSSRSVQKRLRKLAAKTGMIGRLHPHALRHAHATALLRIGIPTELIRQSLSHESIATTARYLHSDEELLRAALERLPRVE